MEGNREKIGRVETVKDRVRRQRRGEEWETEEKNTEVGDRKGIDRGRGHREEEYRVVTGEIWEGTDAVEVTMDPHC